MLDHALVKKGNTLLAYRENAMRYAMPMVLLLAGCAQTPNMIRENPPTMHKVKSVDSVHCMARNIENFRPPLGATLVPTVRPLPPGMELVVMAHSLDPSAVLVAEVMPEKDYAVAKVWVTDRPIVHGRDTMKATMLEGCGTGETIAAPVPAPVTVAPAPAVAAPVVARGRWAHKEHADQSRFEREWNACGKTRDPANGCMAALGYFWRE